MIDKQNISHISVRNILWDSDSAEYHFDQRLDILVFSNM